LPTSNLLADSPSRAQIRNTPFGGIMSDIMVDELTAVLGQLGGEAGVGRAVRTSADLSAAIREGFPHEAVSALTSTGLSLQEIASSLDLSLRSLQRRKTQGRLARYESDRLYRLARLVSLAANFLGDHKTAIDWLKRPNHALGGVAPLAIIDTELGARQVENVLGRIGYGGVS
jgi:putative toxin-antitoxin system antitoxin component (TIGR02293 family)